ERYDSDLQLYYLRARYFNPLTGRFITRDPSSPKSDCDKHRYLYACADPINRIDPSGLANKISRALLAASLSLGGWTAGVQRSGEEVDALLDYGVDLLLRAKEIETQLALKVGPWVYWRVTIAVADVGEKYVGPFTRYIAASAERVSEALENEAAAAAELQE